MLKFHSNIIFSKNIFSLKASIFWGKVFAISLFFLICSNSKASAKTAGNYLGVDLVTSKIAVQNIQYFIDQTKVHRHTNPTSVRSYGISYNYAFNYKNFFIAPGLIFENNRVLNHLNRQSNNDHLINNFGTSYAYLKKRYGIKFDLGYDMDDNIAVFLTFGQALNYYKNYSSNIPLFKYDGKAYLMNTNPVFDQNPFSFSVGKKYSLFYGGGFKIRVKNNWFFNGEYNYSKFSAINHNLILKPLYDDKITYPFEGKFKTTLSVFKAGLSYNF